MYYRYNNPYLKYLSTIRFIHYFLFKMIIENIDSSKIEKVTNQIEIMVQSIQPDYVKREFKIKNKEYTYHGPENNETANLLQMLSQMESKSNE